MKRTENEIFNALDFVLTTYEIPKYQYSLHGYLDDAYCIERDTKDGDLLYNYYYGERGIRNNLKTLCEAEAVAELLLFDIIPKGKLEEALMLFGQLLEDQ